MLHVQGLAVLRPFAPAYLDLPPFAHRGSTISAQISRHGNTPNANDILLPFLAMVAPATGNGRRRRVCVYARFSTDEQNCRSIDDQVSLCKRWLGEHNWDNAEIIVLFDQAVSGEQLDRAGIDAVKKLIGSRDVDAVIAEDLSRYYRDSTWLQLLVKLAKDNRVKILTVNDCFDSSDSDHQLKLLIEGFHHAQHNEDVARRIRRAADGRWDSGYAMGPLRPGYFRKPVDAQRTARTGKGPFIDEIDSAATPIIREAFERVARGDPLGSVASFLTQSGLNKPANALTTKWTHRNIKAMIKNPVYMGVEEEGRTRSQKVELDGKHVQVLVDSDNIRRREMPHLAHVTRLLWQQANKAIADRDRGGSHPRGRDNPSYRIPRASRTPLGGLFVCAICGGKMVGQGRGDGGYRCGNGLKGECWNRATVTSKIAHARIFGAVADRLLQMDGAAAAMVEIAQRMRAEGGDVDKKITQLNREIERIDGAIARVVDVIADGGDMDILKTKLRGLQARREMLIAELLTLQQSSPTALEPVSPETIIEAAKRAAAKLLNNSDEAGLLLRQMTSSIRSVPFQRIDCGLVVLRARFQLDLLALLPQQWRQLVRGVPIDTTDTMLKGETIEVDLFDSPGPVRLAPQAMALARRPERLPWEELVRKLGTTRRTLFDAMKLGRVMEERGLDQAYVELTDEPATASRWRHRA
ncbi:MAG: recombinase family protein [Planctomycetaceae bacterium]|nr:recombinase family protein [Planctomycetaceae bacterium]